MYTIKPHFSELKTFLFDYKHFLGELFIFFNNIMYNILKYCTVEFSISPFSNIL